VATALSPLGEATNNVAEYHALLLGLALADEHGVRRVEVRMDSELVVRQVEGSYKVKKAHLRELHSQVREAAERFEEVVVRHVPREENGEADRLANLAVERALSWRGNTRPSR
jgi:ribonuclease HI